MADLATLEERVNRIEEPVVRAAREAELTRLRSEAAAAEARLPELVRRLEELRGERAEAERKLAEVEHTVAEQRARVAQLGMRELPVEREIAGCWAAIAAARDAARPVPAVVPPRRWAGEAFERALRKIFGLALTPRHKAPVKVGPVLRPGEVEGVKVRFVAATVAGGVSRLPGDEAVVAVSDAGILEANDKIEVLERGVVVPPPRPFAVRNIAAVTIAVDGTTLAPGAVAMVTRETWAGVVAGAYPALGPADDDVQRVLDLERRAQELGL
jgi:hypothetical protein